MNNELLYCGTENGTPCFYSSLYLSIFLSFKAKFVSQFSPELRKLESSNMIYICRMSDCTVGFRPDMTLDVYRGRKTTMQHVPWD